MTTEKKIAYNRKWREKHPDYDKTRYQKNKDRIDDVHENWLLQHPNYQKSELQKKRLLVLIHYGGNPPKCACCGESELDFLTVDHIYGGGSKIRRETKMYGSSFYRWLIENNFPEGYRVLCCNCNWGCRRNNGVCSHVIHRKC